MDDDAALLEHAHQHTQDKVSEYSQRTNENESHYEEDVSYDSEGRKSNND